MAIFYDHLMEELLEGIEPPLDEVEKDLCDECSHDQIRTGACGCRITRHLRVSPVRAIEKWFLSPAQAESVDAEGRAIPPNPSGPVVARVIKTTIHPQSGKLSIVRILSGTIKADSTLTDISQAARKCARVVSIACKVRNKKRFRKRGCSIVAIARLEPVAR